MTRPQTTSVKNRLFRFPPLLFAGPHTEQVGHSPMELDQSLSKDLLSAIVHKRSRLRKLGGFVFQIEAQGLSRLVDG